MFTVSHYIMTSWSCYYTGLKTFLKVKVTSTLRDVMLGHENERLIINFRNTSGFNISGISHADRGYRSLTGGFL